MTVLDLKTELIKARFRLQDCTPNEANALIKLENTLLHSLVWVLSKGLVDGDVIA